MIPRRSIDDTDSQKSRRIDLPLSNSSTQTGEIESVSSTSSIDPSEPNWPRTWRAYFCWLGCFFLMFNSWGLVNAYGTFASFYVGNSLRETGQVEIQLIGATQCFIVLAISGVIGRLLDAGHFRAVVCTGAFLVPFGMFMLSVAHPTGQGFATYYTIWLTQGLVVGLGQSCFFVSSSQIAATWFPKRKGLAVGMVACGASIAGVVYPTMTRFLIDALGFNNACRCVAGLVALTSLYSAIFASPNPAHLHHRPQSYRKLATWIDPDAFRNKPFIWFTIAVMFLFFGFYPVFFNLEEWAAVSGFGVRRGTAAVSIKIVAPTTTPLQTFYLLSIMNGASTIGRLTMAAFCDKTGQLNMHIVAQLISSLFIYFFWTFTASTATAIAFCVCFGMTSGAVIGLPPASMANILACTYNTPETKHIAHTKLGHWVGMMYSCASIPSLAGPIIAGYLVSKYENYITVQMWSGTNLLLSAVCMIISRWYLPCYNGERVGSKLARMLGRDSVFSEKAKGNESDTEAEFGNAMDGI